MLDVININTFSDAKKNRNKNLQSKNVKMTAMDKLYQLQNIFLWMVCQ